MTSEDRLGRKNILYIGICCDGTYPSHVIKDLNHLESGSSSTMRPPHRYSIFSVSVLPPDATTKPMASSHNFTLTPSFGSFGANYVMMCSSPRPASLRGPCVPPDDRISRKYIIHSHIWST